MSARNCREVQRREQSNTGAMRPLEHLGAIGV
jgi:hypothetical protein